MRALFSDGVQKKGALWKPNGSGGRLGAGKPTGRRNEGRMKLALHGRTLRVAAIEPTLQNKCVVPCDPIACTSTARHPILWHKESHTLLWLLRLLLAFSALIPPAQSEAGRHRRAALLCGRSKTGWSGSVHLCSRCRCCCDTRDAQLRCCSCACALWLRSRKTPVRANAHRPSQTLVHLGYFCSSLYLPGSPVSV